MPAEPSPQLLLFNTERSQRAPYAAMRDMQPAARRSDPSGSDVAAERLRKSGLGGKQRTQVFHALRLHPGFTSKELARVMGVDRYCPARRLIELEKAGWVCRGRRRKCRESGIRSVTWFVTRPWTDTAETRAQVPKDQAEAHHKGQTGRRQAAGPEEGHVTTIEERRRIRDELRVKGGLPTQRFLETIEPEGTGGKGR